MYVCFSVNFITPKTCKKIENDFRFQIGEPLSCLSVYPEARSSFVEVLCFFFQMTSQSSALMRLQMSEQTL